MRDGSAPRRKGYTSALPATMRAAAVDRLGDPKVLTLHSLPVPTPAASEVLIRLDTAGVGIWDIQMREAGTDHGRMHFPFVLGTDGAGTIAAVGPRIRRFKLGERVYAYSYETAGFYAEYVAVAATHVAPIPKGFDLLHAGAMPTIGLTALQGIDDALGVKKDESLLIHGAAGGVGSLALQFAKWRGARVLATALDKDGIAFVRRLGADDAVDTRREDVAAAASRFAPNGVDGILALAGGEALENCLNCLRKGGQLAYPNGIEPEPAKRRGIKFVPYDGIAGPREFERLSRAAQATKLKVEIAATYPLVQARKAQERVAAGHVLGKVVLRLQ
jgi:NADPH:quinone reductase